MPWITKPGLNGKIYVPENALCTIKKHPCKDCFSCQQCGDDRCRICRAGLSCREEKETGERKSE